MDYNQDYTQYLSPREKSAVNVKTFMSLFGLNFCRLPKGKNKAYELQYKDAKIHLSLPEDLDKVLGAHIKKYTSLDDELEKLTEKIMSVFHNNALCGSLIKQYLNNYHAAIKLYEKFKKIC